MKFGIRVPSLKKRFAARTSLKRVVRHSLGLKAPRGWGFLTSPKKALYNRVYNRTSIGVDQLFRSKKSGTRQESAMPTPPTEGEPIAPLRKAEKKSKWLGWGLAVTIVLSFSGHPFLIVCALIFLVLYVRHKKSPELKMLTAIKSANKSIARNDLPQAIENLTPYKEASDYELRNLLGTVLCKTERHEEALPHLRYCYLNRPEDILNTYHLMVTLFNLKKYSEVIDAASTLPLEVQCMPLMVNIIGAAYESDGKTDLAIQLFKDCIGQKRKLEDSQIDVAINLAKIFLRNDQKPEAKKYLLKVLSTMPTHPEALSLLEKAEASS